MEGCTEKHYAKDYCKTHYEKNSYEKKKKPKKIKIIKKCIIDGCNYNCKSKGYCSTHYSRFLRNGDAGDHIIQEKIINAPDICSIIECKRDYFAKGYCSLHYERWKVHGDPNKILTREHGTGHITKLGYIRLTKNNKPKMEHRLIMEEYLGRELLLSENVHHKNGNRSDNKIDNLELWSTKQPRGQRIEDKIEWAKEILTIYENFHQPTNKDIK